MKEFDIDILGSYFINNLDVFTINEFIDYLKEMGMNISKDEAEYYILSSNLVFFLPDDQFITRAGVFSYNDFSFKPSREEIRRGRFIIGHRCMPFVNPNIGPDSISVFSSGHLLKSEPCNFSMNLALDTFALYGEGYSIPCIINDDGNTKVDLKSVQYSMPAEISLTSWSFSDLEGGKDIKYGDRIMCSVGDWGKNIVCMYVEHASSDELAVTLVDVEREKWYSRFEKAMLESFEKYGPRSSIEEQLAFLYLDNINLCVKSCGSVEEVFNHTTKIGFEHYGIESRIWKVGEDVPFVGSWNNSYNKEQVLTNLTIAFTPNIVDQYIKNDLYNKAYNKECKDCCIEDLLIVFAQKNLFLPKKYQNDLLLNIKKRRDILEKDYNPLSDCGIADIRDKVLRIFLGVCLLLSSVVCSRGELLDLPQQELVILFQLYENFLRLLSELENDSDRSDFPVDDVRLSLSSMEDTFKEIDGILKAALDADAKKGFEIISDDSKN